MEADHRHVALGALLVAGIAAVVLAACDRQGTVLSQEKLKPKRVLQADNLRRAGSQFWTATVHSTGKPGQQFQITDPGVPPSEVSVEVSGADGKLTTWEQVGSLREAGPEDRAFAVRVRPDGTTLIRFGDGKHGAVPPAGDRNIRVRYVGGSGGGRGVVPVEAGVRPVGKVAADWVRETVDKETADALRAEAHARTYRVVTCKNNPDGSATITTWEVPGSAFAALLRDIQGQPKQMGEVLAIDPVGDGDPKE